MKKRRLFVLLAVVAMVMAVMAPASAKGPSNVQKAERGWNCVNAGPSDYVHCFAPSSSKMKGKAITVNVFDSTDVGQNGNFLGTELLIHEDVYNGQPCSSDDGHEYHLVPGLPYFACHHYDTGS